MALNFISLTGFKMYLTLCYTEFLKLILPTGECSETMSGR